MMKDADYSQAALFLGAYFDPVDPNRTKKRPDDESA
jgi:hypothetical protein